MHQHGQAAEGPNALLLIPGSAEPPADMVEEWLFAVLAELPQPFRLQVALVALDLVAGARTTGTPPFVVQLSAVEDGRSLAVAVDDCTRVHPGNCSGPETLLVAGLSSRWGVEQRAGGRTRWAVIDSSPGTTRP